MSAGTVFHLIRHASYDLLGHVLAGRSPGHSLNETGRTEAVRLADTLATRPVVALISSPVQRARETAVPISARLNLPIAIEPDLDEINFGDWTGRRFDELHPSHEWRVFNQLRSAAQIPGGETMLCAQARAVSAILRLRTAWPEGEIAIVSHGDIVKALLAYFLGVPLDLFRRIEIAPASRSVVRLHAAEVRIEAMNLPAGA
jgi:probable phosphoglycerate mutase